MNPELLSLLATLVPEIADFLSSLPGGLWANIQAGKADEADWDEFQRQLEESNEAGATILRDTVGVGTATGGSAIQQAQNLADLGTGLATRFFHPDLQEGRFEEAFGSVVEGFRALPGQVGAANERVQQLYGSLRGELQAGAADLRGGFEDILGTATGLVSQLGEAERQDINRRFTEAGTESQMLLAGRGLGGSTISSSIRSGVERERSTALLGLQEQTAQQQLGVQETFGLAGLSARERLLGAGINLGGQQAQAMQFGNQLFAGTASSSLANLGGIAGGQVGAYDQGAANLLNALQAFRGGAINTQLRGAGLGLQFYGPNTLVASTPGQSANVYPPFS